MKPHQRSRRQFLARTGALVVTFSLAAPALAADAVAGKPPPLPGSLEEFPLLDAWIRIEADGRIVVFTGKVEFGQGLRTALLQIAAEELMVAPAAITLVTADTALTPNEGYTAGSQSMQYSGTAIRNAAAQAREILRGLAAARWQQDGAALHIEDGRVYAGDRHATYAELVAGETLHVRAQPSSSFVPLAARRHIGRDLPRVDIPGKVTGAASYVQDLRLPGMLHARVVRPPSYGARLAAVDTVDVERMPGVVKVVRDDSYLAVIAEREWQAVRAWRVLQRGARWDERETLPADGYAWLGSAPAQDRLDLGAATPPTSAGAITASYRRPWQMHASIGPSCALALQESELLTVWTHTQGVYPLRDALAELVGVPKERVRCIHAEGAGCYGHNAADDAAADAALLARALPGRPVRVQWMREDEHAWEPYGSAMLTRVQADVDGAGNVARWNYEVWSGSHSTRPGAAGNLAPAWSLAQPFAQPVPRPLPLPTGDGDRNAIPGYRFADARVMFHFIPAMPLRVSALRSLGAYANVFSVESFMDELALRAAVDPVEYRLRHLEDPRGRAVVQMAAERFGWTGYARTPGRGRGFAYARYKTLAAYFAIALEVDVDRDTGRMRATRVVAAIDSGDAVSPDGIRNQTEGGIVQSLSWSLFESVAFDRTRIRSRDFGSYPILRFADVPDSVDVHVINRPGLPFLGTGEAAQGPTAAALANALADAAGVRVRELPLSAARVKAALRG